MSDKPHHPLNVSGEPRAFFGRRSGKRLHKGQDRLFKEVLPELQITLPEGVLDPAELFPQSTSRIIEIGYGGGEHLARQARQNPATGFIGCEVFSGGIAKLVQSGHVNLIETLAERIAANCLADPRVLSIRVRIEKPDALPSCRSVGIEIERRRG